MISKDTCRDDLYIELVLNNITNDGFESGQTPSEDQLRVYSDFIITVKHIILRGFRITEETDDFDSSNNYSYYMQFIYEEDNIAAPGKVFSIKLSLINNQNQGRTEASSNDSSQKRIPIFSLFKINRREFSVFMDFLAEMNNIMNNYESAYKITSIVSKYYHIRFEDLLNKIGRRKKARAIAVYLIRKNCGLPFSSIGYLFGNRDQYTIIHMCEEIEQLLKTDKGIKEVIAYLQNIISKELEQKRG